MSDDAFRPAVIRPAERYGDRRPDRRRRTALLAAGATGVAAAVGWVVWVALASGSQAHGELLGFRPVSPTEVEIRVAVDRDPADDVACVLRARGADGAEVGRRQVLLPPGGPAHVELTETVRTLGTAVSGEVLGCLAYDPEAPAA